MTKSSLRPTASQLRPGRTETDRVPRPRFRTGRGRGAPDGRARVQPRPNARDRA